MKKNYVRPVGNVVALQMDENIALSFGFLDVIHEFTLAYRVVGNQKFIKDTNVLSRGLEGVTGATLDAFYLIDAIMDGKAGRGEEVTGWENCNANPEFATYSF